jgi:hypothetical protein
MAGHSVHLEGGGPYGLKGYNAFIKLSGPQWTLRSNDTC